MDKTKKLKCPNCGSDQTFFRRYIKDKRWGNVMLTYYKCLGCLIEFHLDLEDVTGFYTSGEYERRAGLNPEKSAGITRKRTLRQIAWLDESYPEWRMNVFTILDIGARAGVTIDVLRQQGFDASGYDLGPSKSGDVSIDISATGNYDLLWMSHVLEHCQSPLDTLKFWMRYGKKAFVEVPPGNYQLPHVSVFERLSFDRMVQLAGARVAAIDPSHLVAVLEW